MTLCAREPGAEVLLRDGVDERALTVDLDHRQPFAVARLQRGVARDVHLAEVEAELAAQLLERRPRALAQVALVRAVEDDGNRYG